jgi:hypothetical protein
MKIYLKKIIKLIKVTIKIKINDLFINQINFRENLTMKIHFLHIFRFLYYIFYHLVSNYILNYLIGWVSYVACSSYFHIFIVLSHSPDINLHPLRSKVNEKIPFYAAIDPG